jgi:hypothetical protein
MMFSGFAELASQIRSPWPVHVTSDLHDYSQADQYQSKGRYVWLKHPSVNIREDFPLSWIPDDEQDLNIHVFSYCKEKSKHVIRPDALKLVPTDPRIRREDIRQTLIAGYDKNPYIIIFVSKNDNNAVAKFKKHQTRFPTAHLIKHDGTQREFVQKIMTKLHSRYVWIIDIDVKIDYSFELYYKPSNEQNTVFTWPVRSAAYTDSYTAGQICLYPYSYFRQMDASTLHTFEVVDCVAGTVTNASNPMKAYTSSYLDTIFALTHNVNGYNADDLVDKRKTALDHNLAVYINRGIVAAQNDYYDENISTEQLTQVGIVNSRFKSDRQLF